MTNDDASKTALQAYEPLRPLAKNLYVMDGDWKDTKFRRRMTVMTLRSGEVVIHNAIRLHEKDYQTLERLGPIAYIVVPNTFHSSEAHFYKTRFPSAKLLVSPGALTSMKKRTVVDGVLPSDWPPGLKSEIECIEFSGTRILNEVLFFQKDSRTLVVTDLVFNMRIETKGAEKLLFKLNKIDHRFGPSRIFRLVFVNDKKAVEQSLRKVLAWDFDRVIMNHGEILETGGREALIEGFNELNFKA